MLVSSLHTAAAAVVVARSRLLALEEAGRSVEGVETPGM